MFPCENAEAERNKKNRMSTKPKPICILGPISLQNAYHKMRKEQGDNFTPVGALVEAHKVRETGAYDEATRDYCEKVQELEKDVPVVQFLSPFLTRLRKSIMKDLREAGAGDTL